MIDVLIVDTVDGGDHVFKNNDLQTTKGFQNMVYLALFGGNVEESTKQYKTNEQRFDWWGNDLFFSTQPSIQFNSDTERLLNNVVLSSETRPLIEQTVKNDLWFMNEFSEISVSATIQNIDKLLIEIAVKQPQISQSIEFSYIWDNTRKELVTL